VLAYTILIGRPKGKRQLGKHRGRFPEIVLKEMRGVQDISGTG
jgi:hypothetical protein